MPTKLQFYAQMADQTAQQLTGSLQAWTGFLTTAARLYKYPYHEQLMIYAQRPEATACADYDLWNKTMRRYVRRGSQGIALIDTSGDNPRLKYVFDVSDTGGGEQSRRPYLWAYRDEHYDAVTAALERRFDVASQGDLADQLETIATQLVNEYWQDNQYDILGIVDGSFLSEYDDFNVGAAFRNAAIVSTTYALLSRCGLEPEEYFTHEDFLNVFDFNTPATVAALGTAVSVASEQVLRQIEVTIKNYEREKLTERTESYDRADLPEERRLPDPQPDADRAGANTPGQVREDAEEVPARASSGAVESDDPERNPVPAPAGDRRGGEQPYGADDPGAGKGGGRDGGTESQRPADLDRADELLQGPGRGSDPDRADLRITDQPPILAAEQISLFPTEAEQIEIIMETESESQAPFAFSLPQEDIDQLLRVGSNTEDARTKIALEFMKQKPASALTAFVKQTYHDGYGLQIGSGSISSWAADDGLHIMRGTSARYARTAQVLSWEDATARIGELLEQGRFATNVELIEAPGFERRQVAESLWYLSSDMSDAARDGGWLPIIRENWQGGFPEATERLAKLLENPASRQTIMEQLTLFTQAWREDASLMRFRHYRPDVMLERVAELGIARREYGSDMAELPAQKSFITEDEIDANLSRGGSFEGGAGRVYSFWQTEHTPKEKADFLKSEYGTGGGNNAISRNFHSWEDHSAKGITLRKPFAEEVNLSWAKVAKRIDAMVAKDRYLTPEGKAAWEKAQAENGVRAAAVNEYNAIKEAHPDEIVLFQVGDFFELYGEDARTAARLLDFQLTSRNVPGVGRIEMCGLPSHQLDFYLEKLRDTQDAVVASISTLDGKHTIRVVPSIDHEAAQAIDAHEAEFGADGYRAFPGNRPEAPTPAPPKREITQADIDRAIQAWNGNIQSKHAVVRYMEMHGREKQTAEWLAMEFNATADPFHISVDGAEMDLSWPKVQRRIAQLIKADRFYTQQEYDNLDDIDPIAIRERLESAEPSPFVQQVMADVERIAGQDADLSSQAEKEVTPVSPNLTQESGASAPDKDVAPAPEGRDTTVADSPETREFTPYHVGDTVYLEDTAFEITAVGHLNVELRDPALSYPIYRSESREQFERMLYRDRRNLPITDYLAADLERTSRYLQDALTGDGGLLEPEKKEQIAELFRSGEGNARVASYLAASFGGSEKEMTMPSGYTASLRADVHALDLRVNDQNGPVSVSRTSWENIAPMLRAMYQQEQAGFFHELPVSPPEHPALPEETVHFLLQETLVGGSGMLELEDKERIAERIRAGNSDAEIAERLGLMFSGNSGTLVAADDTGIEYTATDRGITMKLSGPMVGEITYPWAELVPYFRGWYQKEQFGFLHEPANAEPTYHEETTVFYPGERNGLPFDVEIRTLRFDEPEHDPPTPMPPAPTAENFRILDDHLGEGGPKEKFWRNIQAITTLKQIEDENRQATPEEQHILSQYVGWGGLADAFDPDKPAWAAEYSELKGLLTDAEYTAARGSTLNAHYTSPTVIRAIYEAVGNMGFQTGNILEPSMGVGNFFGMLPEEMRNSRLYGVELDSISGRIAKQLYPQANITVAGFETTDRRDFYDLAVGNVPFGQYQVDDRAYNKLGFSIHNYFFAKALDQVRPGGVVAFVTSRYTMDAKDPTVRKYLAQRADLLGAIRLPNNAFRANAGTDVVSDIIFPQKRDHPIDIEPEWVHLGENDDGFSINNYFVEHPEMILGRQSSESTQYGRQDFTVEPIAGLELSDQLHDAIKYIRGTYEEAKLPELGEGEGEEVSETLPADPDVKNYSFTVVDGEVYYRENSIMVKPDLNATAKERVKGMVELRDCVRALIDLQMDEYTPDSAISEKQAELNRLYDAFTAKYGLINDRGNRLAFADDDSYYLLCSLEVLDENGELERKADFFTKRTIKQQHSVDHVDTAVEALGVSIGERACVDLPFMASLMGGSDKIPQIVEDLQGVLFKDPATGPFDYAEAGEHWDKGWQTADEYLSGNVRRKLRQAERAAEQSPEFRANVEALRQAQPKDLDASEIEVRLGTTWIDKEYFQQFMYETFDTPYYLQGRIRINYSPYTAEWQIEGKSQIPYNNVAAYTTYGTDRANAYRLLEDALNLRDTRIYDTVTDPDGKERRVLNAKETTLAAQKQQLIRDAFKDWVWRDPERRAALVKQYNEEMNSTRPREYDGSHIVFSGMNPEITLRPHQRDAIAHVLYGGNTLLAHEVGAGKTFEMVAAAMESKRLGLCSKSIFVVPNHLTDQWAAEFLRLYPSANILVTTKKDFQKHNRKKFCARIATGDYDAVIIGHSQFEKIPISPERQIRLIEEQIEEITNGIEEVKENNGERFTIKELERTKKGLEARLKKLQDSSKKDDVVTFEQLGVDRMFVDESDNYKNLFLYTKMRNVAGLSTTDAQKSSDMFAKCRYMDELTGGRGVVFATGTPVSNSMTELYTIQRYLQYDRLQEMGMGHFDCWASRFGETTTALELAPEGTGYRARTRFAKFFNLPELMNMFKEVADIKTADQLHLPTPEVEYHNFVSKPTEIQKEMVKDLSERASRVHSGAVDAHEDNMLKITSDGRKLGLDQRIINPMLPDEEGTKVNQCVDNILQFWRDGEEEKLTQLVFCDISTPKGRTVTEKAAKAASGNLDSPEIHALETFIPLEEEKERPFTIYEDIRQKLMAGGMPEEQIAFIHDADTEVRKRELFAKVRSGQVRVLIGSTQKMGAGTNVQDRLIALHDLDCPWRPRDLTQRKGRIERQGNQNELVHVCRYVTEGTFDAYLWQTVENKQKFISQIMTSKSPVRSCDDVDETALSFAEIKALCAGDPRIKERMDLDVEVSKLKIMKADHQSKQYRLEDQLLKYFPEQIEQNKGFIRGFQTDMKTLEAHPLPQEGFVGMTVRGDVLTDKENAGAALIDAAKGVKSADPVDIGSYRGFSMAVEFSSFTKGYILTLKGQMTHRVDLGDDPRGNLTRIDNALAKMPDRLTAVEAQLDNLYQQQAAAQAEVGKPFPYEADLTTKTARLVELDLQLNLGGGRPQPQPEQTVAKREKPSILERLKQPLPQKTTNKHKTKTLEASL